MLSVCFISKTSSSFLALLGIFPLFWCLKVLFGTVFGVLEPESNGLTGDASGGGVSVTSCLLAFGVLNLEKI